MEDKSLTLVNGADASEFHDVGEGSPARNGYPSEKSLTLAQTQSDEDIGEPDGTIEFLHEEIRDLKGKHDETLAEMELSEAEKKTIAAHVSDLEGELFRTQHDLFASSSAAEDAEAEAQRLRIAVRDLEGEKSSLAVSKAALLSRIKDLEEQIVARAGIEADLDTERESAVDKDSKKGKEISLLELKAVVLEEQLRVLREEKEAMEAEAMRRAAREVELEKSVEELKKAKSKLESRIDGLASKFNDDLELEKVTREVDVAVAEEDSGPSWPFLAATLAGSAVGGVSAALLCLRYAKQR